MKALVRNYITSLRKHAPVAILNLLGLAAAFVAFTIILMQVSFEFGFDRFRPAADRIYRLENNIDNKGFARYTNRPDAENFMTVSPHIESAALFYRTYDVKAKVENRGGFDNYEYKVSYVSDRFPETMQMEVVEGSGDLSDMSRILIPRSMADRIFGPGNAIGQTIVMDETFRQSKRVDDRTTYQVGGVYEDIPENSIIENAFFLGEGNHEIDLPGYVNHTLFLRLDSPSSKREVEELINRAGSPWMSERGEQVEFRLHKVTDIYFSDMNDPQAVENQKAGNKTLTTVFLVVAVLVLLIAVINFLNFSVAQIPGRVSGINLQKILGSGTARLRAGMLAESVIFCLVGFAIALLGVYLIGKSTLLTGMRADMTLGANIPVVLTVLGIAVAMALAVGLYPTLYATSLPPALTIRGSFSLSPRGRQLRTLLVGFQYVVSIGLIIAAVFMNMQYRLVCTMDMGFNKEQVIAMDVTSETMVRREALKTELLKNPHISDVTFSSFGFFGNTNFEGWGAMHPTDPSIVMHLNLRSVDEEFIPMMEMRMLEGRPFMAGDGQPEGRNAEGSKIILNRTASQMYGLGAGDRFYNFEVIGVIEDFNYRTVHTGIEPAAMLMHGDEHWQGTVYVKANTDDYRALRESIYAASGRVDPANGDRARPYFLESYIEDLYSRDSQNTKLLTLFSILAIIMSLSGVFSIINFEIGHKRKEIGVRRVFGASIEEILALFNRSFVKLVLVCFVIATPVAAYGIKTWLTGFAVRVPVSWWVFAAVLTAVMAITALSVTWLSYRTATENPVKSLGRA